MQMKKVQLAIVVMTGLALFANAADEKETKTGKAGYKSDAAFAGPASTTSQLAEDDAIKDPAFRLPWFHDLFQPWFDAKSVLKEKSGLQLGMAYTALYQKADGYGEAASGILKLSGSWALLNPESGNTGSLVFSADARHRYTTRTPGEYDGLGAGYHGISGALFSNAGYILGDLNWQQRFNDGHTGIVAGRYDPSDFFDVLGYANPWTAFQNVHILFNTSIALPDWSTGIGAGHWLNDQWYIKGAVNDANGVATSTKFFEDYGELYTTAEIGWSPSRAQRYLSNLHIMGWHVDEREDVGVEESEGITIGANVTLNEFLMGFVKAGWSDGSSPMYNKTLTVGAVYHVARRSDLLGIGMNWGEPSSAELRDQYTGELFYRLQFAQNLAITPSVQLIIDPALNPDEDEVWIVGARARVTL